MIAILGEYLVMSSWFCGCHGIFTLQAYKGFLLTGGFHFLFSYYVDFHHKINLNFLM